jgi:cytochrome b pre-mRNA-processing protein 3
MSFARLKQFFSRDSGREGLVPLYAAVVAEARDPFWYRDGAVPDTLDGRFDMLGAIMSLALLRLDAEGEAGKMPAVLLTEVFIDDMDGQLRQAGIGDIVVGKHIGRMLSALGGRLDAYGEALDQGDLEGALVRNIYRGEAPETARISAVAARVRDLSAQLARQPLDALLTGLLRS